MPIKHVIALTAGLLFVPTALLLPADAGVLKQGKTTNGHYWQLVSTSRGFRWLCRKAGVAKFQKQASCQAAGASKP